METLVIGREGISKAASIIRDGGLVAVPTETVYGLAANAYDPDAVARIYEVKGRPEIKPISLLVGGIEDIYDFCLDVPEAAGVLAQKFWPGPLTLILRKNDRIPPIVTANGGTVGVRCPDHAMTLALIKEAGVPLAAPSANISGQPSARTLGEALAYFDGKIECALDGGESKLGRESTILDLTVSPPEIIRQGALPRELIFEAIGGTIK